MKLEWLTIREFARELGVSSNVVRSAIRRCKLLQSAAYWGECWTLYAEKHGRDWRIPVVREPDTGFAPSVAGMSTPSRAHSTSNGSHARRLWISEPSCACWACARWDCWATS